MSNRVALLVLAYTFIACSALAQAPDKPAAQPAAPAATPPAATPPAATPSAAPAAPAAATPPAAPKAAAKAGGRGACVADAKKFCGDVVAGGGRVYKCLTSHDAELAPACSERLKAGKARFDEFSAACKTDAAKYCQGIPAGGGRIVSCLKGRESDLSADCKGQFNRVKSDTTVTQ
jgi:pyruvate/2-oxoglutarate dehydrogenase complex dihydrolipoamide acyltransferase (E2) component